ncbi:hypothetical protein QVD17_01046 [Tagetes erecta]|uniref:Uncharacterized protein n=1 Tax=Tagetes erecta TaxID=13708 RepID=A0AAD8P153_TARER|nr:hypothetical protein QVD17_01046 [Tagetes erecta]
MSKVDGKFKFSPVSVNFLTEFAKVVFAVVMLLIQFVSPVAKVKEEENGVLELESVQSNHRYSDNDLYA